MNGDSETIGGKLQQARERKGIQISEAHDETHIRVDFLREFESNNFNQDLPEIYKRGFLKIYARYLGLDGDRIVADYHSMVLGYSPPSPRRTQQRESLGRMEMQDEPEQAHAMPAEEEEVATDAYGAVNDKAIYLKIGIFAGAVLLFIIVVAVMIAVFTGGKPAEEDPTQTTTEASQVQEAEDLTIEATGDITRLIVRNTDTGEALYNRSLSSGESITIPRAGALQLSATHIENVRLRFDNGQTRAFDERSGGARVPIPAP